MKKKLPAKCGGFETASNVFMRKPAREPHRQDKLPSFFSHCLAAVTLTAVETALLDLCDSHWAPNGQRAHKHAF